MKKKNIILTLFYIICIFANSYILYAISNFKYINVSETVKKIKENVTVDKRFNEYISSQRYVLLNSRRGSAHIYYLKGFYSQNHNVRKSFYVGKINEYKKHVFINIKNDLKSYKMHFKNDILKKVYIIIKKFQILSKNILIFILSNNYFVSVKSSGDNTLFLVKNFNYTFKFHKKIYTT